MRSLTSLLGAALLLGPAVWLTPAAGVEPKPGDPAPVPEAVPETAQPIVLTEADAGKTIEAAVGQEVVVRLAWNPTTGFRWTVGPVEGDAMVPKGRVAYEPPGRALPGAVGTFVARFLAVREGEASVAMRYVRPWEKDREPAKTFAVTVNVGGEAEGPAVRIVNQWQGSQGGRTPARRVVTDQQSFRALWKARGRGEPPEIDFTQHTVLVVDMGMRNTGGYAVSIQSVALKDGKVVARVQSTAPGPGDIVTQALTSPWSIAEIDVAGKEVEFVDAEPPGGVRRPGRLPPRRLPGPPPGGTPVPQDR